MVIDAFFKVAVPVLTVVVILGTLLKGRLPSQPAAAAPAAPGQSKIAPFVILLFFIGIHVIMIFEIVRHVHDPAFRVIVSVLLSLPVYTLCALVVALYSFIAHKLKSNKERPGV